jgi:hypothetical protein
MWESKVLKRYWRQAQCDLYCKSHENKQCNIIRIQESFLRSMVKGRLIYALSYTAISRQFSSIFDKYYVSVSFGLLQRSYSCQQLYACLETCFASRQLLPNCFSYALTGLLYWSRFTDRVPCIWWHLLKCSSVRTCYVFSGPSLPQSK